MITIIVQQYVYIYILLGVPGTVAPGTPNKRVLMDVFFYIHFPIKDLESSNWNNIFYQQFFQLAGTPPKINEWNLEIDGFHVWNLLFQGSVVRWTMFGIWGVYIYLYVFIHVFSFHSHLSSSDLPVFVRRKLLPMWPWDFGSSSWRSPDVFFFPAPRNDPVHEYIRSQ